MLGDKIMPNNKIERRCLQGEVRAISDNGINCITGTAARFNSLSEDLGGFREVLSPNCFSNVLQDDVRALFNHDSNYVLGRTKSNTLTIWQDDIGLHYKIVPPNTQFAKDLIESINRGDISGSSFGFSFIWDEDDTWSKDKNGTPIRTINRVQRLYDVSPVTYPAYPETDTTIARRSIEKIKEESERKNRIENRLKMLESVK